MFYTHTEAVETGENVRKWLMSLIKRASLVECIYARQTKD